MIVRTVLGCIV